MSAHLDESQYNFLLEILKNRKDDKSIRFGSANRTYEILSQKEWGEVPDTCIDSVLSILLHELELK